jgi:predicted Holliday junction resolvase-like endonuclease
MAEALPPPFVGPPDPLQPYWMLQALRSFIAHNNAPDVSAERAWHEAEKDAVEMSAAIDSALKVWGDLGAKPELLAGYLTSGAYGIIAWILSFVTGLTFDDKQLMAVITGPETAAKRSALGKILTDLYGETLKTELPAAGWLARNPGEAELENFRQLSGAAMRLSLSDILIKSVSGVLPLGLGDGLRQISEKINDAVALDDALEEVVQVPMQAVIQRGLEAKYNRELKPADLSATEAFHAEIAGKLKPGDLGKILDNAGYRDDVRQTLRDFAAGNLTEGDLDQLYQHNLLSREEVKEEYKQKFFEERERELKTKLVEGTRRWKLKEKVFELYGNLYRDGVATKQEVTPFLDNYGYDADEVEMWFQVQELERRQRKWISDGNLLKLVMAGKLTFSAAIDYLVLQGMERGDATTMLTLAVKEEKEAEVKAVEREVKAVIAKLPAAVKDKCDDLFKPEELLSGLLSRLVTTIPFEFAEIAGFLKLREVIECALKNLGVTPPATP